MQDSFDNISDAAIGTGNAVSGRKLRRQFSVDQKREIVVEANASTVLAAARNHDVKPNQIRDWRRKLFPEFAGSDGYADRNVGDLRSELQSALLLITQQQKFAQHVAQRLERESESGKATGYSLACGLSNVTNSLCKLLELRLSLVGKLQQLEVPDDGSRMEQGFDNPEECVRQEAEKLVYELVKQEVEAKRAATYNGRGS